MAHLTLGNGYAHLEDRLNRFPQGAPPGRLLHDILAMLFSEREAELVSRLPIRDFTAEKAARLWKLPEAEARRTLDSLADRGILLDLEDPEGRVTWCLPPPMAGFFEFAMMRVRDDLDQKLLAELFYQYLNVEDEFVRALFTEGETRLGRVFVREGALSEENALHVLDYERASEVVRTASHIGVGVCYCRHKMAHLDRACDAPLDICMTFNSTARSLVRHGIARGIDAAECLDLLDRARDLDLVQFGENVRQRVNFICNCCGCCCDALVAQRRFGPLHPVHTTNFLPVVDEGACSGCGKCVAACPVEAMALVSAVDPRRPGRRKARVDGEACLGCGVCIRRCDPRALRLESRAERVITPLNATHRVVVMAIERGTLQDLVFDERVRRSHRVMAAVLGAILRLPPVRQAMARRQFKSRYLESLFGKRAGGRQAPAPKG